MTLGNNKYSDDELQLKPLSVETLAEPVFGSQFQSIKGKRLFVIIAAVLAVAIIVALIVYFRDGASSVSSTKDKAVTLQTSSTNNYFFEMPEIVTNLAPINDKESWIKFAITLQLENSKDQAILDKKIPMIKDSIIVFLREIRSSDLASSGGSLMLKTELLKRVNKIMYPIQLKDILFREILLDQ